MIVNRISQADDASVLGIPEFHWLGEAVIADLIS
jgi:hypothetical protein